MFRYTRCQCSTVFQNPRLPRIMRTSPEALENVILLNKERKKCMRYHGSHFQAYNDRAFLTGSMGSVKGGKKGSYLIIEQSHNRVDYLHPGTYDDRVDIRAIKTTGDSRYAGLGGFFRMSWDHSLMSSNGFSDMSLARHFNRQQKDSAIEIVESWGVNYVLLDEVRKPSLNDCMYHRHHLYAHKFHWSPEPPTNHYMGDPEYQWKGDEQFDYKDFGAQTKNIRRNGFARSLWERTVASKNSATAAVAGVDSSANAHRSKPAAAKESA